VRWIGGKLFYVSYEPSYNPSVMTLWKDIVGHEWAVRILSTAIENDRLVHAYLISGPAQVGKSTLAWTFAQALNCLEVSPADRPCGKCRACQLIGLHRHPDVIAVRGELGGRGKRTLKIDQLRELQQALNLTPAEGRFKVAIIDGFNDANPNAANAFLKTLEEPPNYAVLILTAVDPDVLLPTIPSRCQQIGLRSISVKDIEITLVNKWEVEPEEARKLARLSDGRIGWAINAAQESALLEERAKRLTSLHQVIAHNRVGRFKIADKLAKDPEELLVVLRTWLVWWRDLALFQVSGGQESLTVNSDDNGRFVHLAALWESPDVIKSLRQTDTAIWQLERNANTRLVIENLLLVYPYDPVVPVE
jgi:DNA polymerase-3 subunit delta'